MYRFSARCKMPRARAAGLSSRVVGERLLAAAEQGWRAHLPHRGGDRQGHEQLRADELLRGEDVDAVDCADREPSTGAALTCPRLAAGFDEGQGGVATLGVLVGRPGRGQLRVDRVAQAPGVVCFERRVERRQLVGEAGDLAADPGQPPAPCVEGFPVGLLQCVEPADGLVELDLAEIAGVTGGDGLGRGRGLADIAAAEVLDLADVDLIAFGLLDEQCLAFHFLPHHRVVGGFGDVVEDLHLRVLVALADDPPFALFQVSGPPRHVHVVQGDESGLDVGPGAHLLGGPHQHRDVAGAGIGLQL